jgi:hypothetical protein
MATVTVTAEMVARISSGEGRVMTERERSMTPGEFRLHRATGRLNAAATDCRRIHSTDTWGIWGMTVEEATAHCEAELEAAGAEFWAALRERE